MKPIILDSVNSSQDFLYKQLYNEVKSQIVEGDMEASEKCPSIRSFAYTLGVSVTTVMQAYNQLVAEGYIVNRPGSGYYVSDGFDKGITLPAYNGEDIFSRESEIVSNTSYPYIYDEEVFDFNRWKKCANKVFTEYSQAFLYEADVKGEYELRLEIAKYLQRSRGVHTRAENIVVSAGTQQIAFHLGRILKRDGVNIIAIEKPGYAPVKSMFKDAGFQVVEIPVRKNGIDIGMLPANLKAGVYVNPANQFPTGVVMPADKRYEILEWAKANDCYIIEDDYNSELRYFGQPLPPIKSLDASDRVIYLGSFSSTLFPAIRISYMVLTDELAERFDSLEKTYAQTCSKAEQLTLAQFMKEGYYYTTIKKKRSLYTKKLQTLLSAFDKYGGSRLQITNHKSGLTTTLKITTQKTAEEVMNIFKKLQLRATFLEDLSDDGSIVVSLYYSDIPLSLMEKKVKELCSEGGNTKKQD